MELPKSQSSMGNIPKQDWKNGMTSTFRDGMTDKMISRSERRLVQGSYNSEQAMVEYGSSLPSTAREMESRVFSRAASKIEYMDFMGRMIIHLNIVGSRRDTPIIAQPPPAEDVRKGEMVALLPVGNGRPPGPVNGMAIYPKTFCDPRLAPYDGPLFDDPVNEFQPDELQVKKIPRFPELCDEVPAVPKMENHMNTKRSDLDEDVKQYICRLIMEDRERQLKKIREEETETEERKAREKSIDEFADLCVAKVNEIQDDLSKYPSSENGIHEETGREFNAPPYLCDEWSHKIFKDPVITPSGHTYERSGIEKHLKTKGNYDPVTRLTLTADLLVPNLSMRQAVGAYMSKTVYHGSKSEPVPGVGPGKRTIIEEESFIAAKRVRLAE